MENIKYILLTLFLSIILIGWYTKSEEIDYFSKDKILNEEEVIKYIKNPKDIWYYKESLYTIVKKRSNIPFKYSSVDTLKKPKITFYSTSYPQDHGNEQENNSCGCN
jgi:hypothetical protein